VGHAVPVDRTTRLVVHVEEAIRLGTATDVAHLRLGLMLLDSAAELLMHRQCSGLLSQDEFRRALVTGSEQASPAGCDSEHVTKIKEGLLSNTRRKKIAREFDAKAEYLCEHGLLADAHVRVLKKLHEYRNETYHRDKVRPGVLASTARIYIYVVCTMMIEFPVKGASYLQTGAPPSLAKYIRDGERFGFDTQAKVGAQLLEEAGLATQHDLGLALGRHIHERLDEVYDAAEFIAKTYGDLTNDPTWELESALGAASLQVEPQHRRRNLTADACRAVPGIKPDFLVDLGDLADGLGEIEDPLTAFGIFANIEDAFEPVESRVLELAGWVDGYLQHLSDVARGK
jgi:hypothetical protein